ncbi:biotin sulfoxide reductase [Campylobacter fetus subsp. testudinum]|uniref:molybdopterin-dependent oxidoreductase n=1 Tax=Campylobacter fetus TaxID=196 RepID=UPI000818B01B|nr:molybdopterin-dependent oxidoreductase [Campylobacter fetus]OCR89427.1 biotin sulfoxide reductase [Campylobacter fetus subsp. testudinum]OCS00289.1 biotin sulfoxide reductase [Campylobacter fetus subsp. testudinum]
MLNSRRNFLKGVALSTAACVSLKADELLSPVQKVAHASNFGPFYALTQDGKIIDILPHPMDKRPTAMTKMWLDRVYSPTRIKYPCVRKSYLDGKEGHEQLRGKEEFVRVSWDKALELVANKIKETPKENIYNATYIGWSHPGGIHSCPSLCGRFFNVAKRGAIGTAGEYSNGAAGAVNVDIIGDVEAYSLQTTHEQILENTKTYVMWGADLFKCNKIDTKVPSRENDLYYPKYAKSDINFISIDPIYTETAQMLKARWIKIRPNTDIALMLGMMHHLYTSGKYDKEFIAKYTDGFDQFLPYLLGKTDKTPKTPKWASSITEIDEKTIIELANLFVKDRTFLAGNWAMQRAQHGEMADWCLIVLASMIGQIGLAGGGVGFSMHFGGGGQAKAIVGTPAGISQGRNRVEDRIPASRIADAILNPGKKYTYKGKERVYPTVKIAYVAGCSIVGHHPDTNNIIKALRTLDTFIVQEPWWTPTAKMADIVLPACSTLERNDIAMGGVHGKNGVYAMKKAIEPLYESKSDLEIFSLLAMRFGKKVYDKFTDEKPNEMDKIKYEYDISPTAELMSFEKFWEQGYIELPRNEESYKFVRHAKFRNDPVANKLATISGKIQITVPKFSELKYKDFSGYPTWIEPDEWLGDKNRKYPLHLLSPHPNYRVHSQGDNTYLRSFYKINDREPVMINPNDAKKYGISHGDVVEIYNDRGRVLAGAFVTEHIRQGVMALQEGAWYSPENTTDEKPRCVSGHINVLTSNRPTSSMAQATSVNTNLVGIKKATGVIPPNSAYNPPKIIEV